jgi:hypothetical protein
MKFDVNKLKTWMPTREQQLPGITKLLANSKAEILIIGAAVFEFYEMQDWIVPLRRKTGDIDISVGLLESDADYKSAKAILDSNKYKVDAYHPYRYHSPKKTPGGYTYVDLLAHPANPETSTHLAIQTMGVGPGFTFNGFGFAKIRSFPLIKNVIFPNPFGLMALKRESYLSDPVKRVRDFADIVELIDALSEKAVHYDMENLWKELSAEPAAKQIKTMLLEMRNQEVPGNWDFDNIRNELKSRSYTNEYIDSTLLQRVKDFGDFLT